ncbi:MAG: ABC transporter permease [Vagococcus sp.]|uniref:ABC transporter permease n=1 Tax=Vagococcus sp. TaxID=1933889 RepID=UPI002FCB9964
METWSIYKVEITKLLIRKNSLILLLPTVLAIIMSFAISKDGITLTGATQTFSCVDFITALWAFFSGLGIWGILILLVSAFLFSGEINNGQIKLILLRVNKRSHVVIAKFLALITCIAANFSLFTFIVGLSYYLFISESKLGNGQFASKSILTSHLIISLFLILLYHLLFIGVTFLIGQFLSPVITFIFSLLSLFVVNYLTSANTFDFLNYSPSSLSSQLLLSGKIDHLALSLIFSISLLVLMMTFSAFLFKRIDIK